MKKGHRILMFVCSTVLFAVIAAIANTTAVIADSSITVDTLVNQTKDVVSLIKSFQASQVTIILVVAAVIKLAISIMKLPAIAGVLDSPKIKPLKPYIALVLGVLSGLATSIGAGEPIVASLITGLAAGFSSVGIHETLKSLRKKND